MDREAEEKELFRLTVNWSERSCSKSTEACAEKISRALTVTQGPAAVT